MTRRTPQVVAVLVAWIVVMIWAAPSDAQAKRHPAARQRSNARTVAKPAQKALPCGDYTAVQILLDRQGFSPGHIDGRPGASLTHAVSAFQSARDLNVSGRPDCETWQALGGDSSGDLYTTYMITADDANGPFQPEIP